MTDEAISIFTTFEPFREGQGWKSPLQKNDIKWIKWNWMSKISFELSLGRSFDSASVKNDRLIDTMEN